MGRLGRVDSCIVQWHNAEGKNLPYWALALMHVCAFVHVLVVTGYYEGTDLFVCLCFSVRMRKR